MTTKESKQVTKELVELAKKHETENVLGTANAAAYSKWLPSAYEKARTFDKSDPNYIDYVAASLKPKEAKATKAADKQSEKPHKELVKAFVKLLKQLQTDHVMSTPNAAAYCKWRQTTLEKSRTFDKSHPSYVDYVAASLKKPEKIEKTTKEVKVKLVKSGEKVEKAEKVKKVVADETTKRKAVDADASPVATKKQKKVVTGADK
jgi:hypothetical protein